MTRAKVDLRIRSVIIEKYSKDPPPVGVPYDRWCQQTAEETGLSAKQVNNVIVQYSLDFKFELERERKTVAQQTAAMLGADERLLINKIIESLDAYNEELVPVEELVDTQETVEGEDAVRGKNSQTKKLQVRLRNYKKDAKGKWLTHRTPDFRSRVGAIRELVGVLGAKLPEHIMMEVQHQHTVTLNNVPTEDLQHELEQIRKRRQLLTGTGTASEGTGDRGGTAGAGVREGSVRVVDARYENVGRTGPDGQSAKTFSEAAVHTAAARRARKREGSPDS